MKTFLILISALLLFIAVSLAFIGGLLFFIVCSPKNKVVKKFLSAGEKELMDNFGDKISKGREIFNGITKEDVTIKSFDNLSLHAYYIEGKCHDRTIICVHGYYGSPEHDFGPAAVKLLESADLLLIDQRCHGQSEGKFITFGIRECKDIKSWCDWVLEKKGENHPVYLDGVSMGATTVLLSTSQSLPKNIRGIIADCGFSSPHEILSSITKKVLKTDTSILLISVDMFCRAFAGFSLNEMSTSSVMQNNEIPILFAHGKRDSLVPYTMSQAAFDACKSDVKYLVLSEDAEHGLSYVVDFEKYNAAINELFKECERKA